MSSLHLRGGGIKGGFVDGSFRTEDHDFVRRGRRVGSVCAMLLGTSLEVADVWRPGVSRSRSHYGSLATELETDGHHAERDSEDGVGLRCGSGELRTAFLSTKKKSGRTR